MDPEFGDDLLNGFSDEEIQYGEGEGEEEACGLDLLTAMLDSQASKKEEAKRSTSRKRTSSGHERRDSHDEGNRGGVKRRKLAKKENRDHLEKTAESANDEDEMSQMRAQMQEMQREMKRLREEVKKAKQHEQQQSGPGSLHTQRPSPPLPPTVRTEATRLPTAGEKRRVARQSTAGQKGAGCSAKVNGAGMNGRGSGEEAVRGQRAMDRGVADDIIRQRQEDEQGNIITEKYSRLRIKNPLVSSDSMRQRMDGRKMISIPKLHSKVKDGDIEGDWVTIGVIVDKLPPRDTVKGDKYAIWKLSDLSSQTAVISLFLFGKSYQEHWKTSVGTVIALLNPSIMPGKESADSGPGGASSQRYSSVALSLDNPLKLMVMGVSQDFTVCRAVTKSGKKCTNFASKANGSHCDYHIQSAYSRMRAQRMEFQTGYGPNPTKGKLKERLFKDSKTDVYYYGGKTFTDPGKSSSSSSSQLASNERGAPFERMFIPGAHATASKAMEELRERREAAGLGGVSSKGGVMTHQGSEIFKQMLQTQSIGARMLSKHFYKEDLTKKREEKVLPPEKSASELLQEHKRTVSATPLHRQPQLGRGIGGDGLIDLSDHRGAMSAKPTTKASLAKLKALEIVQKSGALERAKSQKTKKSAAITKRVEENRRKEDDEAMERNPGEIKKQRLDSAEFQRILNAKSSHDWVVKEEEREREEEYFDYLEKKENIEEKMVSLKELRVNVVQCKLCNYTAEGQSELCRKEQHRICRFKAVKKCFQCRDCHERCFAYNAPFPVDPCRKCGGMSYEPTSFYRERKGPKLPTEQLLLRGEEEKFLNSLK